MAYEFVTHLTSFEGEHIDAWLAETQEWGTGSYAEELAELFDAELRSTLREAEVRSEGTVLNLFIQDISGDEAIVFAVVRQTVDNRFTAEPFDDELRIEVTMHRIDRAWFVSDVGVLGPGGLGLEAPDDGGS